MAGRALRVRPSLPLLLLILCAALAFQLGGAAAWQYCEDDDIYGVYGHCLQSIQLEGGHVPPSDLCCSFISDAEKMACVCRYLVTPEVEGEISVARMVAAAHSCGATLKPKTKCGNYTVPVFHDKRAIRLGRSKHH